MIGRWDGIIHNEVDERTVQKMAEECWQKMAELLKAKEDAAAALKAQREQWRYLQRIAKKLKVTIQVPQ